MAEKKRKILVLVEGAKTDVALMERLFSIYQIDFKYEIVSYCTNIYTLYKEMFEDNDPDDMESSDVGKLYINYPMVEAFYHMTSIPDLNFNTYNAALNELSAGTYKARVNRENRNHDYRKFAATKEECNIVIGQNISKAWLVVGDPEDDMPPSQAEILNTQLNSIQNENRVAVLSTCAFFIPEYNLKLIR